MAVIGVRRAAGDSRFRLHLTVSSLALVCALPAAASAQTTPAPASRDDTTTPQTDQSTAPSTDQGTVPAGASAGKKPVSDSTSIANQSAPDQSNVTPADTNAPAAGEIVVTGLRQSLANAQAIKRNADTVVDAITAEDIGALPDRSVNEALQRIPGVAITRFAAPSDSQHFSVEGSGVEIRGLTYTRGEFNGRDTFSANGGREIGFNDVPTELVGSIEVYKNLTSDLVEGGIAGTVNINTRKPFDSKGQLLYLSGGVNYGDLEKRSAPSIVGVYSNQWNVGGGRIGFLVSGSYSQQYSRSDAVYFASPFPRYNDDKNGNGVQDAGEGRTINAGTQYSGTVFDTFPVPAGQDHVYVPTGGGSRTQDFNRERIGVSGALQYENNSRTFLLTAQYLRADSREAWVEHTIEPNVYYNDVTATFPAPGSTFTYDGDVFTSGTLAHTGGTVYGNDPTRVCGTNADGTPSHYCALNNFAPGGQFTTFSNRFNATYSLTQDHSLNLKWEPIQRLHLNFDGQYVTSKAHSIDDIVDAGTYSQVSIDNRGGVPQINLVTPGFDPQTYYANPNSEYLRDAFNDRQINDGHEWSGRFDADYHVSDAGFLRNVRAGARYSDREQTVRDNGYSNWGAVSDTWTGGGPSYFSTLPAGTSELYSFPSDFFRNDAVHPLSSNFISDDVLTHHEALMNLLRTATARAGGTYVPLEDRKTADGSALIDGYFLPSEIYKNGEKTWAGYVKFDFGADVGSQGRLSGNIGVRFVHTEDNSAGNLTFPTATSVLPTDNNVDANGAALPPRYTTVAGYCAFDAAQAAASPNPNHVTPAICTITPAQQAAAVAFANGGATADVAHQSYNDWLPSLNIKYQFSPKFLMRFAASKAISRPNFGSLRDYVNLSPSGSNAAGTYSFQASAGNPYLKPVKATQLDLTAEWYFAKVGQLTGAVFWKDLSDIILDNYGYSRTLTNNGSTQTVAINGPANVSGHAKIKGAEISYQQTFDFLPGFLRGFGTQETFTYIDAGNIPNSVPANGASDGSRPPQDVSGIYNNLPLALLSKYNFNANLFYDNAGIYARIAYSWRSKYLLNNRDCCFPYLPVYALAGGQADASLFYTVNKQFKIGIEVQNLLNADYKTEFLLNSQGDTFPKDYHISDRQFQLSVRTTF